MYRIGDAVARSGFEVTEVVSGTCYGIDELGEKWAEANGIPVKPFPAWWTKYGRAAGPIRNQQMADYADALILIWDFDPKSGSADMFRKAYKKGLPIYEEDYHEYRAKL